MKMEHIYIISSVRAYFVEEDDSMEFHSRKAYKVGDELKLYGLRWLVDKVVQ